MTRHTLNLHNKKNSVAELLPAAQETTSGYQALSYSMTVMVGLLSVGLLLQRFRDAMPAANAASQLSPAVTLPYDDCQPSYDIQFPALAPLLLGGAVTYQTGNSVVGMLSSLPLWFAAPVAGQATGVSIVVPEFRVNSNFTLAEYNPAVASASTGGWMVVWQRGQAAYDIYAQRFSANGSVLGSEFRVNSNVTGDQWYPAVASLSTGEWVVVWQGSQTGDFDIYAQRYAANGSVLGSEFRVNSNTTGDQLKPAVASTSDGQWVVVWWADQNGERDTYAQRYAGNGSVLGSEFRVNSVTTGWQLDPAVASTSTGEWLVVWYHGVGYGDIYAQRYAMNGSVLGSEFRVNSNTTSSNLSPTVASASTGKWMVVWQGRQTGDWDIYAQRYAMNGSVLGSEFRVNSNITGQQRAPKVVSTSAGDWVVVWQGDQTGDDDIYAQHFSANGGVLGSEFRVNSATAVIQENPAVASTSTGEWLVVWDGFQFASADVYGSIFSSTGLLSTTASPTMSSGTATPISSTTVKSTSTAQVSSTSSLPLTIITGNSATLSTLGASQAISTLPSTMTSQGSGGSSSLLSTTPQDNAAKTPTMTSSLNVFTSASSAGMTGTTSSVQQQAITTNANSGVSGAVIGAAVGGGVVGIAACLGAMGFYAYRKKSRAGQASHSAVSEVSTSLKTIEQTSAQSASEYAQVNLKDADQSDNMIPVSNSPYGRIDEMKKQEKEYDYAPTF